MIICNLCENELKSKRQAHGHLTCAHNAEYQKTRDSSGHLHPEKLYRIECAVPDELHGTEKPVTKEIKKPLGLRHLDLTNHDEMAAYHEIDEDFNEHYEYIDNDGYCYTTAECKRWGWI